MMAAPPAASAGTPAAVGGGGVGGVGGRAAPAAAAARSAVAGSSAAGALGGALAPAGNGAGAAALPATAGGPSAGSGAPAGAGSEVWISPTGADDSPGTLAMPLQSLSAAAAKAMPGMTIWVGPGTYTLSETVALDSDGSEGKPVQIFAMPGERPVIDFIGQPRGESAARGIAIGGDYWHIRGLDVINAGDNCIHISGAHNTIENVVTHGCSDTGIQISANSTEAQDETRAANNTVLNCDSHDNYDAQNQGENADGFAAKLYIGPGNVFRGCRAWNNADDGWDLFASDDVVVIEDCWAIANGKIGPGQNNTNGDGNGFKLGGAAQAGDPNMGGAVHEVSGCISIENAACGFVRNNNTQLPQLSMCGGRGDGKGLLCELTNGGGNPAVTMTASQAIAAKRDADGKLPPPQ
jgi:hypothetical protein